jgi:hypothetical protein
VDENRLHAPPMNSRSVYQVSPVNQQPHQHAFAYSTLPHHVMVAPPGGRRKIKFRLQEEVPRNIGNTTTTTSSTSARQSLLGSIRRGSRSMFGRQQMQHDAENNEQDVPPHYVTVDRGGIAVSWFEGTSSLELHEHVRKSVVRKLKLQKTIQLSDMRVMDETADPPEGAYIYIHTVCLLLLDSYRSFV